MGLLVRTLAALNAFHAGDVHLSGGLLFPEDEAGGRTLLVAGFERGVTLQRWRLLDEAVVGLLLQMRTAEDFAAVAAKLLINQYTSRGGCGPPSLRLRFSQGGRWRRRRPAQHWCTRGSILASPCKIPPDSARSA
ncbi:hypothetical protein ABPG75_013700 [Micractinium tetrahymenae]